MSTTSGEVSWFMLNLRLKETRPLNLRGGGPPSRPHVSAVRILAAPGRRCITVVDTQSPAVDGLRAVHERYGPILTARRLEAWAVAHERPESVDPNRNGSGRLLVFGLDGCTVAEQHTLTVVDAADPRGIELRLSGSSRRVTTIRWRLEISRHDGHLVVDQWATTTTGDARVLLKHTLERLRPFGDHVPTLTVVDPPSDAYEPADTWFTFHKRDLRISEISLPRTNPYRSPLMLVGRRSSTPPHIFVCDATHTWFDRDETLTGTGTAVKGEAFLATMTSATASTAAESLMAALRDSEILISLVEVEPTGSTGTSPIFRRDLILDLTSEEEIRNGIPVLCEPLVERPIGGYSLRGQIGTLGEGGTESKGLALLLAVAHPDGRRYVVEYLLPLRGGGLLHDLLQDLAHLVARLGFHEILMFDFRAVPSLELTPVDDRDIEGRMSTRSLNCQARTFDVARRVLSAAEPQLVDPLSRPAHLHALDELAQSVLRDPDEHSRISRLLRIYQPAAEDLLETRSGHLVVSLVVAELCVETALPVVSAQAGPLELADLKRQRDHLFGSRRPVDVFADALTSYLRAQVTEHARTRARAVSRILNLVSEWLTGAQRRPHNSRMTLDARALSGPQLLELRELLRRMPWLAWHVTNRTGPRRFRIRLDHADFLEVLGLARPRTRYVPGANSAKSNPGNWRSVLGQLELSELLDGYVIDEVVATRLADEPRLLDDLARACEAMYHLPWQARRAVQSLTELGELAAELDALASAGAERRMGSLADVAVVVDAPGGGRAPRVCLINADGMKRCQVTLDETRYTLAEYAVSVPDAAFYMTAPYPLPDDADVVRLSDGADETGVAIATRTGLDEGSGSDSEWVNPTLFRGRHAQLNQMLGAMHPSASVRVPIAVFGPRGAGKTTLAVHACRQGISRGWLHGLTKIDLFLDPVDSDGEAYLESLTRVLVDKAERELGMSIDIHSGDPAAALDAIDRAAAGRPVGIILDEFDRLLSHDADSPLQRLAIRLGGKRWQNLAVIATIQRFYKNAAELETWQLVGCPADLSWRDGVTYFAQPLLEVEEGARVVAELRAPVVLPIAFRDFVHRRLGLRPFLWGRLRRRVEGELLMSGSYAIADPALLETIIDGFIDDVQYLGQPLQESEGVSLSEARRRDLFTEPEKRVLACFATTQRKRLDVEEAIRVGGQHGVRELEERAYAAIVDGQLQLTVPLFGEYLRAHALDFQPFVATG